MRGALEQANERGGDCRAGFGDGGLVQTLMSSTTISDLLEDTGREGTVSSCGELVRKSPSYMHSLRELWHEVHGRPASHLCPHNPRSVISVKRVFGGPNLLFRPMGKKGRKGSVSIETRRLRAMMAGGIRKGDQPAGQARFTGSQRVPRPLFSCLIVDAFEYVALDTSSATRHG